MWLYFLILGIFAWFGYNEMQGKRMTEKNLIWAMVFFALFVGMSDMLGGYDRYIYAECFDEVADYTNWGMYSYWSDSTLFEAYGSEFLWCCMNVFISFFTKNRYIFILLVELFVYFNLYYSFKRYSEYYALAIVVFLGFWFFFTFTYLRQVLAVSVAWYGLRYIEERDLKRFSIIMLVAFLFHNSAVILFPMYFIPPVKFERKDVIKVAAFVLLIGLSGLPSAIFDIYSEVSENAARAAVVAQQTGGRFMYLIEAAVVLYVVYANYDKLFTSPRRALFTNMTIAFAFLLMFFFKSENGGRLCWYYVIGLIVTFANVMAESYDKKIKYGVLLICIVLCSRIIMDWDYMLYPYKTFLTDGVSSNDLINMEFEYDERYIKDKFYR